MQSSQLNVEIVASRLIVIISFVLGATMLLLSLSVSTIRQTASLGEMGPLEWGIATTIPLTLVPSLVILFVCGMLVVTVEAEVPSYPDKVRVLNTVRRLLGVSSILILTSFGSIFLIGLGTSSPWSWGFAAIGYSGAVVWHFARRYYVWRYIHSSGLQSHLE